MENQAKTDTLCIEAEFAGSRLHDKRSAKRLPRIAKALAADPGSSIPNAVTSVAEREATYRFLENDRVSMAAILDGHFSCTAERAFQHDTVYVIHDTSKMSFTTKREGLGRLRGRNSNYGFYSHVSLCAETTTPRSPLGLLEVQTWTRTEQVRKMRAQAQVSEMRRWFEGVLRSESRLDGKTSAIHLMDREGDSYELFCDLLENGSRFIIRSFHNRRLPDEVKLVEASRSAPLVVEREVPLSRRQEGKTPKAKKIYPARKFRWARLEVRATSVSLLRSTYLERFKEAPAEITLNVVCVTERDCPDNEPPVEWRLLTTEPIETSADVLAVVDGYRTRWLVEELFKALKTGCQYQRLQLASYDALLRALAIYLPIAWLLLRLRYLSGTAESRPATAVLNEVQIQVLRLKASGPLPAVLSCRQALLAVAEMGGHIKNNGEPGWLVLQRGLHDLLLLEQGFRAAMKALRCDQ